ncbi:FHA domain-containing protein [bacterium]|nr:FHA domain-containing protein [bacterium]
MRRFLACAFLAAAALAAAVPASASEARRAIIRAVEPRPDGSVRLVVAFFAGDGSPATQIHASDIRFEVDDKPVAAQAEIAPFGGSDEGSATLLAVDASGSIGAPWDAVKKSLAARIRTAFRPKKDVAAMGAIRDDWQPQVDFTDDAERVARAVEGLDSQSTTTALFQAVSQGIDQISGHGDEVPARRTLVVVSDGLNKKKGRTADECIAAARRSRVQVNALIFVPKRTPEILSAIGELEKIATDTGGRAKVTSSAAEIGLAFGELRQMVLAESVLTIPAGALPTDGREHALRVACGQAADASRYAAPLIAVAAPGAAGAAEETKGASRTSWLFPIVGLVAVVAVVFVVGGIVMSRSRRRAAAEAEAREEEHRLEAEAREREAERLRAENERLVRAATPQPAPAAPAGPRRTEYRAPTAAEERAAGLRVLSGAPAVYLAIPPGGGRIGARGGVEILLDADSVSGQHAEIVPIGAEYGIRDLGSTNGTFVDGARIGAQAVPLRPGSQVRLGLVVLRCE